MTLAATTYPSPVGPLRLVASDRGLRAILWPDDRPGRVPLDDEVVDDPRHPVLVAAAAALDRYFEADDPAAHGRPAVPLDLRGTDLQLAVWRALAAIPFGTTTTYGELARTVGRPSAARAVGAAVGRNPVSVLVPCHRVVGADGRLTGFAGGVDVKRTLLAHEAVTLAVEGTSGSSR